MKKASVAIFFMLSVALPIYGEPALVTQQFHVPPRFLTSVRSLLSSFNQGEFIELAGDSAHNEMRDELKEFCAMLGMTWPDGSAIKYIVTSGEVELKNTQENLEVFENIIKPGHLVWQVEVSLHYVVFDTETISAIPNHARSKEIVKLWKSGTGELICAPRILSQSGCKATLKELKLSNEDEGVSKKMESSFMQIIPEVSPDEKMINIDLSSELITTNVLTVPDETILIGGGYPISDSPKLLYVFLTTHLFDADGNDIIRSNPSASE